MSTTVRDTIRWALDNDEGALIGRNGTIELDLMLRAPHSRDTRPYILEKNAGVFPIDRQGSFTRWRDASIQATKAADILAMGWYEPLRQAEAEQLKDWGVSALPITLRDLEPYYSPIGDQWTSEIAGQRVAVVSCFTQSMKYQVTKGWSAIWCGKLNMPNNVDWAWIQTGHAPKVAQGKNEWPPQVGSWEDAVSHVVQEVIASGARIAIIGCGGLGMIIGSQLKDRGVICIVMGGAIQVLFGIKGRRWETHSIISKFWNDEWVWPLDSEKPGLASSIEGGCYW